jgi:hypothetical protein
MANKQISDLTEMTVLSDAVYLVGEDGISTKKLRAKVVEDYIRQNLFFNYYQLSRASGSVALTDLLTIAPTGDYPTQKITFESFIDAVNRLNGIDRLNAISSGAVTLSDLVRIGDSQSQYLSKKMTFADLITAINRLNLFSGLPAKTTLADSDILAIQDAANNDVEGITISNLKTSLGATQTITFSGNPTFTSSNLLGGTFHCPSTDSIRVTAVAINSFQISNFPAHIQFLTHATTNCNLTLPSSYQTVTPVPTNPLQKDTYYEISLLNGIFAFSQGI